MARTVALQWQPDPDAPTTPPPPEVVHLGNALEDHAGGCVHCALAMRDAILLGMLAKLGQFED